MYLISYTLLPICLSITIAYQYKVALTDIHNPIFRKSLIYASKSYKRFHERSFKLHAQTNQVDGRESYSIKVLPRIGDVDAQEWNSLLERSTNNNIDEHRFSPFLMYEWLHALESSGCASSSEGWQPLHLLIYSRSNPENITSEQSNTNTDESYQLVAALPLYAKYHSQGEFIFDHQWAEFAERVLGIRYYPKLLSAIPMTPATGPRVLIHESIRTAAERRKIINLMASFLKQMATNSNLASANVNFMLAHESDSFVSMDYSLRETIQFRWENYNNITKKMYTSFEDYLSCFKSKRRVQIKSERKKVYSNQPLKVMAIRGDCPMLGTLDLYLVMFELYKTTVEKMWGSQYLNEAFFVHLFESPASFRKHLLFIVAVDTSQDHDLTLGLGGRVVAGTINVVSDTHFSGRYWGAFEFVNNLHFEVCYYKAIEYCIEHGIQYMEPGAGGGEFKYLRGFNPYKVRSVHWFTNNALKNAVDNFLVQERAMNQEKSEYLIQNSALGKNGQE